MKEKIQVHAIHASHSAGIIGVYQIHPESETDTGDLDHLWIAETDNNSLCNFTASTIKH